MELTHITKVIIVEQIDGGASNTHEIDFKEFLKANKDQFVFKLITSIVGKSLKKNEQP